MVDFIAVLHYLIRYGISRSRQHEITKSVWSSILWIVLTRYYQV